MLFFVVVFSLSAFFNLITFNGCSDVKRLEGFRPKGAILSFHVITYVGLRSPHQIKTKEVVTFNFAQDTSYV